MPNINYHKKEINFKIVYFGPAMSGKTTNLVQIHKALAVKNRGDLVSLDTTEERTLFFDFFPIDLGEINGYGIRLNMFTVPGQVYYEASRRLILDGADGVVFVADSQIRRLTENMESYKMMEVNLRSYNKDPKLFPLILQYNKRDYSEKIQMGSMERLLNLNGIPVIEAIAIQNRGVMETVKAISKQVIGKFKF